LFAHGAQHLHVVAGVNARSPVLHIDDAHHLVLRNDRHRQKRLELSCRKRPGRTSHYDEYMAILYMSEAEVARDLHAVLAKVQQGTEIVIEQNHRPVAILRTPPAATAGPGRKLNECIALAKDYEEKLGYTPVSDADFAQDVQAGIDARRDLFEPPAWD